MTEELAFIRSRFSDIIRENEPMSRHTTFRVGGPAELFAEPDTGQLGALLAEAKKLDLPVTIVGNGSNLLVSDEGLSGLVIGIGKAMSDIVVEGQEMSVGAGALLAAAAGKAAACGLSGMEFAAGIPGSLGGAVVMNAGAYGGEMKDILSEVRVCTRGGERITLAADELKLGYRSSIIPEKGYVVLGARLHLTSAPEAGIRQTMAELREKRVSKQPLEFASAGSTFKRPEGCFAGKLIQDAGLSGYCVGDAQVSEKHCGFVINRGNATAAQIYQVIRDVQEKVYADSGVKLEPEVRLLGFS